MAKTLFKRILVGFAFSPNLKANTFPSLRLANSLGAKLFFVHVGKITPVKEEKFKEILNDSPVQPKLTKVLWEEGSPIPTILKLCAKNKSDWPFSTLAITFDQNIGGSGAVKLSNNVK